MLSILPMVQSQMLNRINSAERRFRLFSTQDTEPSAQSLRPLLRCYLVTTWRRGARLHRQQPSSQQASLGNRRDKAVSIAEEATRAEGEDKDRISVTCMAMGPSSNQQLFQTSGRLGWIVNFENSVFLPSHMNLFIGLDWNLRVGLISPVSEKVAKLSEEDITHTNHLSSPTWQTAQSNPPMTRTNIIHACPIQ